MNDAVEIGNRMSQEIEAQRTNGKRSWEKYIPGPLSESEVSIIATLAGCWTDYASAQAGERVRFYTNQNHPLHGGCPF